MTYRMPCNEPDFHQSVPAGNWEQLPKARTGGGQYEYRNRDTGETALVPAIWYNQTPAQYAETLLYYAGRSDENAARQEAEGNSWSSSEAARFRQQAEELRRKAAVYAASTASTAGHVTVDEPQTVQ